MAPNIRCIIHIRYYVQDYSLDTRNYYTITAIHKYVKTIIYVNITLT